MTLDRKIVIADVGCRWGFAERFINSENQFLVFGFDPDVEECQRLNARYNSELVKAVPVALAEFSGERTLYLTKEPACSSLLQPDPALTAYFPALSCAAEVSTQKITTTTLDSWSASEGVKFIDFLKIDTQGTELEILKGGQSILSTVRAINVEVEFNPIYLGQSVFADVDQYLRSQGFVLWKLTNLVHYSKGAADRAPIGADITCYDDYQVNHHQIYSGQLYWADAHYIRKEMIDWKGLNSAEQKNRDDALFVALGMPDVAKHLSNRPLKG